MHDDEPRHTFDEQHEAANNQEQFHDDDYENQRRKQDAAATKIQAGYRGYKTRKGINANQVSGHDSVEVEKNINHSTTRIQAGYRGYKTRKDYNTRKTFTSRGEPEKDTAEYEEMQQQENEAMNKQHENEAATKLQAGYRGYKVRKDYNSKKQKQLNENDKLLEKDKAAVKIQAGYRGYQARKAYAAKKEAKKVVDDIMSVDKLEMYTDESNAAAKIQAGYRGYRTRKNYATMKANKVDDDRQKEAAATRIQAGYKGYKVRKNLNEQKRAKTESDNDDNKNSEDNREGAAATRIQAGYRGYKTRKELKSQVMDGNMGKKGNNLEAEKHTALQSLKTLDSGSALGTGSNKNIASKLKAAFKGYKERKRYLDKHKKSKAALKIQAAYKGYKFRVMKGISGHTVEFEEFQKYKAAMKIRSVFSAYLERKKVRAVKKLHVKVESDSKSSWIKNSETSVRHTPQGPSFGRTEKSYWEDSHIKMYPDEVKNEAVTKIQSAFFSFYTRKKYYAWKAREAKKLQAITRIQACLKGYIVRKEKIKTRKHQEEVEQFASIKDPKSAVEIYGREKESSEPQLSSNNIDRKLTKDVSDKDSCFTDNNSVSEIFQREKSLGYETIVSVSGEVEKEGDSVKEIEDEAGEINAIEKHIHAVADLQAAFRAYRIRKEFQELLSGGGELIDIAKVDRAVSALRKEFKYKSAKVRRLATHQFESGNESNWWNIERSGAATLIPSTDESGIEISDGQQHTDVKLFILDKREIQNADETDAKIDRKTDDEKNLEILQAAFRGFIVRKQLSGDKESCIKSRKAEGTDNVSILQEAVSLSFKNNVETAHATLIQSAVKAYLHRKHAKGVDISKQGAIIQSASKGFLSRKHFINKKKIKIVETKVQAAFKGYLMRKQFKSQKKEVNTFKENVLNQVIKNDASEEMQVSIENEGIHADDVHEEDMHIEHDKLSIIQAAAKSHLNRKNIQKHIKDSNKEKAAIKIQAAFHGYLVRQAPKTNLQSNSPDIGQTAQSDLIQFHATKLQAALAAYQTRKVFISLTKLVEDSENLDISGHRLERMGSLSETDDFKLKHKSIAKIQTALEEHRQRNLSGVAITANGNFSETCESRNFARHHKQLNHTNQRPFKSTVSLSFAREANSKITAKANAHMRQSNKPKPNGSRMAKVSRIENYIKLNMAASAVQACVRGYIKRKIFKDKKDAKPSKRKAPSPKSGQAGMKQNIRPKPKYEIKTDKAVIQSRTASVKYEAEKRKEMRSRVAAKESVYVVKSKAEKLKAENIIKERADSNAKLKPLTDPKNEVISKTHQISEREAVVNIDASYGAVDVATANDGIQKFNTNAIKMGRDFDKEYEVWKQERINAAVMIQSGWRGYQARKDMLRREENTIEFNPPQKLIVINIGRSKSEIERSEQQYNNASMIQMVYRTAKIRRKFKIKMAVQRYERNEAVTKIQAYYRSYAMRKYTGERKVAVRIQAVLKAYLIRKHNKAMKEQQKQNAASLIQASCHSFKTRQRIEMEKQTRKKQMEMNNATSVIQTAYRGFRERRYLLVKKTEMQKLAASRIQAAMRGSLYRKTVRDKQLAATYIRASYKSYRTRYDFHLFKENLKARKAAASEIVYSYKAHVKREEMQLFKEKKARENKAAGTVQSALKGMIARKKEKVRKELLLQQNNSALKIQSFYRGYLGRKMAHILRNEKISKELLQKKQCAAALKIQSAYRGHLGRKIARHERHMQELQQASSEILEVLIERTFSYLKQKHLSAIQLQWALRGYMTRKNNEMEKEKRKVKALKRKKKMDNAATLIQATFRAKQRRIQAKQAYKLREENHAATKIQAIYRGYNTRQGLEREKAKLAKLSPPILSPDSDEVLRNARAIIEFHKNATSLQSAFRAYRIRSLVKDRFHRKIVFIATTPREETFSKLLTHEDKAAIVIQKAFRGFSDRKMYGRLIGEKRKNEHKAGDILKACLKGFIGRKKWKLLHEKLEREGSPEIRKQKHNAANVIASAFRGYQKRKQKVALRAEM